MQYFVIYYGQLKKDTIHKAKVVHKVRYYFYFFSVYWNWSDSNSLYQFDYWIHNRMGTFSVNYQIFIDT